MEKETLTVDEVAALLDISRNLAYESCKNGTIPCLRIGRRLVIPRKALQKMLEEPGTFAPKQRNEEKIRIG
jgi:excisionase family DNA binding protein